MCRDVEASDIPALFRGVGALAVLAGKAVLTNARERVNPVAAATSVEAPG